MGGSYLYVMACDDWQLCKIGFSVNPKQRLAAVRAEWGPRIASYLGTRSERMFLAFSRLCADPELSEYRAHALLWRRWVFGEWFAVHQLTARAAVIFATDTFTPFDLVPNISRLIERQPKTQFWKGRNRFACHAYAP